MLYPPNASGGASAIISSVSTIAAARSTNSARLASSGIPCTSSGGNSYIPNPGTSIYDRPIVDSYAQRCLLLLLTHGNNHSSVYNTNAKTFLIKLVDVTYINLIGHTVLSRANYLYTSRTLKRTRIADCAMLGSRGEQKTNASFRISVSAVSRVGALTRQRRLGPGTRQIRAHGAGCRRADSGDPPHSRTAR